MPIIRLNVVVPVRLRPDCAFNEKLQSAGAGTPNASVVGWKAMLSDPTVSRYEQGVFVNSILCSTDFSPDSMNAFAHALMMALSLRCQFTLLHNTKSGDHSAEWARLPGVRKLLERWGYLEKGSPREAVFEKVAVEVTKVHVRTENALRAITDFIATHPTDLVVVGTEGPSGVDSWLGAPAPEDVVRYSRTMTLFVPATGNSFVSPATGGFTLKRVLVPVAAEPDPHPAIRYAFRTAVFSLEDVVQISLLHVGDRNTAPRVAVPDRPYLAWESLFRHGNVAQQIVDTAREMDCELIVMTTRSAPGFGDVFRGTVTQEIIRSANCPVLAVQIGRAHV